VSAAGLPTSTVQTVSLPTNCLIAGLVSETIPDGTIIAKGSTFTKTWSIRNGGTCTWSTGYKMVFESGDLLGATSESVNLTQNVGPGMMTAISMKLTAPNTDGTYIGYWMLQTDAGVNVGRFSVNVYVGTPTATPFSITSISYPSTNTVGTVGIATTVRITVVADGPGTMTYSITSTYGADKNSDMTFTSAGSKYIDYPVTCPGIADTYNNDIHFYVNYPNHQNFELTYSDLECN
ncbi:MAG: NBR1-Ig-like domain-containing protein, partial [Anaerolineaceae bacterium]